MNNFTNVFSGINTPGVITCNVTSTSRNQHLMITTDNSTQSVIDNEPSMVPRTVYIGNTALQEYLNPENYAPPPLIELPGDLNPFRGNGVRLLAKMMPLVPLMNIKSLPTFSMLSQAAERGELQGITKVIESSSCNTALSLSVMSRLFGIDAACAVVDGSISPSLLRTLRLFGMEVFIYPAPGSKEVKQLQPRSVYAASYNQLPDWYCPQQYTNSDNPDGVTQWLAPDLWSQTNGRLRVLSCALGTSGTMVGLAQNLRQRNSAIQIIANFPAQEQYIPGPRERSALKDVSFPWEDVAADIFELSAKESFAASVRLLRRGILAGPSSGMNYAGLLRYIERAISNELLNSLLDEQGELWCVFICCDSPLLHVDEYFNALGEDFFPSIHSAPEIEPV
jgi:cysteine synthase